MRILRSLLVSGRVRIEVERVGGGLKDFCVVSSGSSVSGVCVGSSVGVFTCVGEVS